MFSKPSRYGVFSHNSRNLCATAAAAFLWLSATAATAQVFMTEGELLATIPGSSISSKDLEGVPWVQTYSKAHRKRQGGIRGIFDQTKYEAKWYVKDGKWCEDWGTGKECWMVERVDDRSLRMYLNGKPRPNLWVLR